MDDFNWKKPLVSMVYTKIFERCEDKRIINNVRRCANPTITQQYVYDQKFFGAEPFVQINTNNSG